MSIGATLYWMKVFVRSITAVVVLRTSTGNHNFMLQHHTRSQWLTIYCLGLSTTLQQQQQQQHHHHQLLATAYQQYSNQRYSFPIFGSSNNNKSQQPRRLRILLSPKLAMSANNNNNDDNNNNNGERYYAGPQQQRQQHITATATKTKEDAGITSPTDDSNDAMMQQQWEQLYTRGGTSKRSDIAVASDFHDAPPYEIRVVSFDLDNTLWNTTATIDAANNALAQHLYEQLSRLFNVTITENVRVETVMGKLYTSNKIKYSPIEGENAKSPVLLTQLRKDAIHHVVEYVKDSNSTTTNDSTTTIESFVNDSFNVWTNARHDAISKNLVSSTRHVMECIQQLTTVTTTTRSNSKVLIGAITDGNSNPKLIPELSNVFDFYVNAEMVGIGKPKKPIYVHAARQVFTEYPLLFHDLIGTTTNDAAITDDQIEELIGPWWVHIGDDFVKDIVASNSLRMRNIWTRELLPPPKKYDVPLVGQQQRSTRTVDELMQIVNERAVVEMSIGADTYLADSISSEFATAVVEELRDVAGLLQQWQDSAQKFVSETTTSDNVVDDNRQSSTIAMLERDEIAPAQTPINTRKENINVDFKFCIACGTKLPVVANFCSGCGEKSPTTTR